MLKLFVDDLRKFPSPEFYYNCVRSYDECVTWLTFYKELDVINLDYELGGKTGLDILIYMKENDVHVNKIIVHSTHAEGVRKMEKYIKENFSDSEYLYCGYNE